MTVSHVLMPCWSELELGLGLSLGGACRTQQGPRVTGQNARILMAKNFPHLGSLATASASSSSSTSSSSYSCSNSSLSISNVTVGIKRSADSVVVSNDTRE